MATFWAICKNCIDYFMGSFREKWATFCSSIWSHTPQGQCESFFALVNKLPIWKVTPAYFKMVQKLVLPHFRNGYIVDLFEWLQSGKKPILFR